jgi:hypothetical protein
MLQSANNRRMRLGLATSELRGLSDLICMSIDMAREAVLYERHGFMSGTNRTLSGKSRGWGTPCLRRVYGRICWGSQELFLLFILHQAEHGRGK